MPIPRHHSLTVVCHPGARTIEMRGVLDDANADAASLYLEDLFAGMSGPVTLLLDGLDELSSRGFELVLHVRRRLAEHGHDLDVHLPGDPASSTEESADPARLGFVA